MRTSVENKYLVETVTAFSLEGPLEASNVVYIDIKRAFAGDGKKICLLITELLPRIDASDLTKSKTLHNQTYRNSVLFPSLITKSVFTNGETAAEDILKIFAEKIHNHGAEKNPEDMDAYEDSGSNNENKKQKVTTRSTKGAMARDTIVGIATNCDNVLAFLQAVSLKAP